MIAQAIKKAPRGNVEPFTRWGNGDIVIFHPRESLIDNLDENQEIVNKLPVWSVERIARLAQERQKTQGETLQDAFYSLENEALIVLQGELVVFPELALLTPTYFLKRLLNSRSSLTDFERGIVMLVNEDAKKCLPALDINRDMDEYIHLKWETLGALLARGLSNE